MNHLLILGLLKLYTEGQDEWNLNMCNVRDCQFVTQKSLPRGFVPPHFEIEYSSEDFVSKQIGACFSNVFMYPYYLFLAIIHFWNQIKYSIDNKNRLTNFRSI